MLLARLQFLCFFHHVKALYRCYITHIYGFLCLFRSFLRSICLLNLPCIVSCISNEFGALDIITRRPLNREWKLYTTDMQYLCTQKMFNSIKWYCALLCFSVERLIRRMIVPMCLCALMHHIDEKNCSQYFHVCTNEGARERQWIEEKVFHVVKQC